ncbi:hypothetical protein OROGR_029219 [Orobanche gracilis]
MSPQTSDRPPLLPHINPVADQLMDSITLFCYWGGTTCQGPDGVSYNKGPNKAIKVNRGMQFDELVDHIYRVTSTDKQQHRIKVMCRYPSVGLGKVIKYVPVPINDNDDVCRQKGHNRKRCPSKPSDNAVPNSQEEYFQG